MMSEVATRVEYAITSPVNTELFSITVEVCVPEDPGDMMLLDDVSAEVHPAIKRFIRGWLRESVYKGYSLEVKRI